MSEAAQIRIKPQSITITDKKELYRCYMPFIKNGGLFIPFNDEVGPNQVFPGQNILIIFSMLENRAKTPINGKVVWISKGGPQKGYGVTLGDSPPMKALKENIEINIADMVRKKDATYTI